MNKLLISIILIMTLFTTSVTASCATQVTNATEHEEGFCEIVLRPDTDETWTGFTHESCGGSTGYQCVSDNAIATFGEIRDTSTQATYRGYNNEPTWGTAKIINVTAKGLLWCNKNYDYKNKLLIGATEYLGDNHGVSATGYPAFNNFSDTWDQNPATDANWTGAVINAMGSGGTIDSSGGANGNFYFAETYLIVAFEKTTATNSPPITTTNITTKVIDSDDTAVGGFYFNDSEDATINETEWQWFVNDVVYLNGNNHTLLTNETQYTLSEITFADYDIEDRVIFSSRVYDGSTYGNWSNSTERLILNGSSIVTSFNVENNTVSSIQEANFTFAVNIDEAAFDCNFSINNTHVETKTVTGGELAYFNYTFTTSDFYSWNISCDSTTNGTLFSGDYFYAFLNTTPSIEDLFDSETPISPEIGDVFFVNASVSSIQTIDSCILQVNDSHSGYFVNRSLVYVDSTSDTILMNYTITTNSTDNASSLSWRIWCNDSSNNQNTSILVPFEVKDLTNPQITLHTDGTNFETTGLSVISSSLYNVTFNVTMFDFNLFQYEINVSCESGGTIYYNSELDVNDTSVNVIATVNISEQALEKCSFYVSVSDDHTLEEIGTYDTKSLYDGFEFITEEDNTVRLYTLDAELDEKTISKEVDRYSFSFTFDDKETYIREFILESDNLMIPRDTDYLGHFVLWNPETKRGNWVDFEGAQYVDYERLTDHRYKVRALSDYPIKDITFNSLGGTNFKNKTYDFYVGGVLNISTNNQYDNNLLTDFNVTLTSITGVPAYDRVVSMSGTSGTIANISGGIHTLQYSKYSFLNKTINLTVTGFHNVLYNTSQGILNIKVISAKFGTDISTNLSLVNLDTGYTVSKFSSSTNITTFFLNGTSYNISSYAVGYSNTTQSYLMLNETNASLTISQNVILTFNLFDEKTLELFNISSADEIRVIISCGDFTTGEVTSTETYVLTNETTDVPISCVYFKYKYILDYTDESYYRTFVVDPDDVLVNRTDYLINLDTTTAIFNEFQIDDLLSAYDVPRIYINKIIHDAAVVITSDFTDIEGKVGVYLIINNEYYAEIRSDNLATYTVGTYSADTAGTKVIGINEINTYPLPEGVANELRMSTKSENISGTVYAITDYTDGTVGGGTELLTWTVREDSATGPVLYTTTSVLSSVRFQYNITPYLDHTIFATLALNHSVAGDQLYTKMVNVASKITLPIAKYLDQGYFDWFFTILLSAIALLATIKTTNAITLFLLGFSSLLIIFGWFSLSWVTLGICSAFALLSFMKDNDKQGDERG